MDRQYGHLRITAERLLEQGRQVLAAHPDKVEMQAVEVMKDVPAEGIRDEHSEGLPGELHRSLHSLHGAIVSLRDGRVSDSSQLEEQITAVQALSDRINAILG